MTGLWDFRIWQQAALGNKQTTWARIEGGYLSFPFLARTFLMLCFPFLDVSLLLCSALLCFALLCVTLLYSALLCFALRHFQFLVVEPPSVKCRITRLMCRICFVKLQFSDMPKSAFDLLFVTCQS